MIDFIQNIDTNLLLFIQDNLRVDLLNYIFIFFSTIGDYGAIWIVLAFALMIRKNTRRSGFDLLICVFVTFMINNLVIKELVARARPFLSIESLTPLVNELSYSFPSGHTSSSFGAATALTLAFGKKGAFAYIPAALIAFSRCYVGVHYPSDVLVGAIVGTLVSALVYYLLHKYFINGYRDIFVKKKTE